MRSTKLEELEGERYIVIETYRKNGEPVMTPVWFIEDQGTVYVRTGPQTGKRKRIRNNPRVRIAPSTVTGRPKGEWIESEAAVGGPEEEQMVFPLLKKKYRIQYRFVGFLHWLQRARKPVVLMIRPKDS